MLDLEPLPRQARAPSAGRSTEVDGHDHDALAARAGPPRGRPAAVVARTVKGYGVGFMEDDVMSHYRSLQARTSASAVLGALDGGGGGGMRDAFFARADRARRRDDERVWALTGDLGIGLFDAVRSRPRPAAT